MKLIPCSHKPGWSLRWISSKIGRLGRRKASLLCPCPHRPTQIRRSVCSMPIPWLTIRLKSMLPNHASNTHSKKHFASQHPSFHLEQGCCFFATRACAVLQQVLHPYNFAVLRILNH